MLARPLLRRGRIDYITMSRYYLLSIHTLHEHTSPGSAAAVAIPFGNSRCTPRLTFGHLCGTAGGTFNRASHSTSSTACKKVPVNFWAPTGSANPIPCPASGFRSVTHMIVPRTKQDKTYANLRPAYCSDHSDVLEQLTTT